MSGWWASLEERTRREVDADVLRDRRLPAVRSVRQALRPLGAGLHEAERVVDARYEALGERVRRTSADPLDLPSLAARAAALPGRLEVPFHVASPDVPDDDAPRWRTIH
ncbi:hypothetical protein ACIGO8_13000 [Streptomyces sp. NPDC053493]|uniref:hypothetical protein n=1 Tax=Streptomyces sp. NPDC053493 TaxID=3365705 RepID=UPI0037CF50B5